eukprot:TRINITY_DN85_c0_g1_i12.p1 TRINITY_DN85_c0_g1~~TRINITY_DN85_c0_g1_i12.p1  ORF type:complete len:138 (-),score=24.08 TRINITY_DN85_c0_g1_i12:188-601(-)
MSQARLFLLAVCCVASVLSRSYPSPATAGCQDDSDCYGYGKICPRDFEMCVCNEHNICEGLEAYPTEAPVYPTPAPQYPTPAPRYPAPAPPQYPAPAPVQEYNPDIGQTNVGGTGQQGPLLPQGGGSCLREPVRTLH